MLLSYYFLIALLPSCITQVTVPNENDLSIEEGINDQLDPNEYDRKHSNEKRFKSNACNANNLKRHHQIHTDEKPLKFQCDLCDKEFSDFRKLKKHNRTHRNEKPYQCDLYHKGYDFAVN
ncbi:hypothetical protein DINM_007110 [Dirofilaria immitis]|nr:hypothetical protein [Dirofilaria immitis]